MNKVLCKHSKEDEITKSKQNKWEQFIKIAWKKLY